MVITSVNLTITNYIDVNASLLETKQMRSITHVRLLVLLNLLNWVLCQCFIANAHKYVTLRVMRELKKRRF